MADIASQAHVRAAEPFALGTSKLCVYLWDEAWQHAPQVLEGDGEALHDMRVALRRLRSTLENCAALHGSAQSPAQSPDHGSAHIEFLRKDIAREMRAERKSLSKIGDALGAVRDFDVLAKYLQDYIEAELELAEGAPEHAGLQRFARYLYARRDEHFAPMQKAIERAQRPRRKREEFSRWAHSLAGVREPPAELSQAARQILALRVDQAVEMGAVLRSSDEDQQHNLRKSLRRLRYTLEAFAPAFAKPKPLIKALTALQDVLGEMQDRSVLRAMLLLCFEVHSIDKLPPGAHEFARFGEHKRDELLQSARSSWDQLASQGFWDALRAA